MTDGPFLVLVNVPPQEWAYPLNEQRQTVGRGPAAAILIPKDYSHVSRRHAEVWRDRRGFWLQDLESRSGTQVNGVWLKPLRPAQVKLHDRIWLGGVETELVPKPSAGSIANGQPITPAEEIDDGNLTAVPRRSPQTTTDLLSRAEHDVLLYLGRGFLQDEEIAQELHRSPNTIRTHVSKIVKILGLRTRNDVLAWLKGAKRETK